MKIAETGSFLPHYMKNIFLENDPEEHQKEIFWQEDGCKKGLLCKKFYCLFGGLLGHSHLKMIFKKCGRMALSHCGRPCADAHLRIFFAQKHLFILLFLCVLRAFSEGLSVLRTQSRNEEAQREVGR